MTRLTLFATASAFALGACAIEIERTFDDPAVAAATEDLARILGDRPVKVRLETDASMAPQEWRVKAADGTLTVTGLNGLGVAYGVYSFLERIGCRWYAPNVERTPDLAGWTLPQLDERGKPAITSRDPYVSSDKPPGIWYLRNKGTTSVGVGGTERTGSPNHCHTFGMYAQAITGRCAKAGADWMCLTDPEVRHAVADEMKRFIRADRAKLAGKPRYTWPTIYELSQDDGGFGFKCTCAGCLKAKESAGSWSGPNVEFTSAVAAEVGKEFPDVVVRTFAYSYTERPPTNDFRAAKNLAIRYCRSFLFQPLTADTGNGEVFRGWNDHVDLKFVWSYWRGYSGPLFPAVKPRADIRDEMRFCRDMHVYGYFLEGEEPLSRSFGLMNVWLFLKLSENPDLDAFALADEFMRAYYGEAAFPPLVKYLDYLERRQKATYAEIDPKFIASVTSGHLAMYVQRAYLDHAFFTTAAPWLEEAERLAAAEGNPLHLAHVRQERLVFDRALIDEWRAVERAGGGLDIRAAAARIAVAATNVVEAWGFGAETLKWRRELARRESERMKAFAAKHPAPVPKELEGRTFSEWSVARLKGELAMALDGDSAIGAAMFNPKTKDPFAFTPYVHDDWIRKSDGPKSPVKIPRDGRFHVVKIGTVELVAESGAAFGGIHAWIPPFSPRIEAREFWVSVKATPERLVFDRFFIVMPE